MSSISNSITERKFIKLSSVLAFDMALANSYWLLAMRQERPDIDWSFFGVSELAAYLKKESEDFYSGNLGGFAIDAMGCILGQRKKSDREILRAAKEEFCKAGEMIENLANDIQAERDVPEIESMIQAIEKMLVERITVTNLKETHLEPDMQSFWKTVGQTEYEFELSHSSSVLSYEFKVTKFHTEDLARLDYQSKEYGANKFTTLFEHRIMSVISNLYAVAYCKRLSEVGKEYTL